MTARPEYRVLVAGQQHFSCEPLRASLSTQACAQRWQAAAAGSVCSGCSLGRIHHADHAPSKRPGRRPVDNEVRACTRCGRSDLRLIKTEGVCVSCHNRALEWRKGRNSRGTPPERFKPLHPVEVPVQLQDGRIERRIIEVRDQAEAIARVLFDLPSGARLPTGERRLTAWNRKTRQFEPACSRCGAPGLTLERVRNGVLQRHSWCCEGDPPGQGWQPATVRAPLLAMRVDAAAAALNGDPELEGEAPCAWTPTAHPCTCGIGQIEAQLLAAGGRWQTRCTACGGSSEASLPQGLGRCDAATRV